MVSMTPGSPEHDPADPNGPVSQLLAALSRAVFDDRWEPFARLVSAAVVFVGLYLLIRTYG